MSSIRRAVYDEFRGRLWERHNEVVGYRFKNDDEGEISFIELDVERRIPEIADCYYSTVLERDIVVHQIKVERMGKLLQRIYEEFKHILLGHNNDAVTSYGVYNPTGNEDDIFISMNVSEHIVSIAAYQWSYVLQRMIKVNQLVK